MGIDVDASILVGQPVNENMLCAICHGIQKKPTTICPGGHTYCSECIASWEEKSNKCPGCRSKIKVKFQNLPLQSMILGLQVKCPNGDVNREGTAATEDNGYNKGNKEDLKVARKRPAKKSPGSKAKKQAKNKKNSQTQAQLKYDEKKDDQDDGNKKPASTECCPWVGTLEDYIERHKQECRFAQVQCPDCSIYVLSTELVKHQHTFCVKPCLQCQKHIPAAFLPLHITKACPGKPVPCPKCLALFPRSKLGTQTMKSDEKHTTPHYTYTGHMAECPDADVYCEFHNMGCKAGLMKRKDLELNHAENASFHSTLAAKAVQEGWVSRRRSWQAMQYMETSDFEKKLVDGIESNHVQVGKYKLFFRLEQGDSDSVKFKLCSELEEGLEAPLVRNIIVSTRGSEHYGAALNPMRQLEPDPSIGDNAVSVGDILFDKKEEDPCTPADLKWHARYSSHGLSFNVRFQIRDYDPLLASFF